MRCSEQEGVGGLKASAMISLATCQQTRQWAGLGARSVRREHALEDEMLAITVVNQTTTLFSRAIDDNAIKHHGG